MDGSGKIIKSFVYASKINVPDYVNYNGKQYRIISDKVGTPKIIVDSSNGQVVESFNYDEFGVSLDGRSSAIIPFGFAGGLSDSDTGLVRFGARDYDPEVGRWTSKDPILFNGGDTNLYGYTWNDPVNFVDPSGLWGAQIGFGFSGFLLTGGAGFNGGLAVVYNSNGFQFDWYTTGQFNGGLGMSFGRGVQASFTPGAQCMSDLGGTSVGVGVDSPLGGFSVSGGSAGPTYSIFGPSLGGAIFGFTSSTQIGSPVVVTPNSRK